MIWAVVVAVIWAVVVVGVVVAVLIGVGGWQTFQAFSYAT